MTSPEFVDYFSYDFSTQELFASWKFNTVNKTRLGDNGIRFENALWRLFMQRRENLPKLPSREINWCKESDMTWLYGRVFAGGGRGDVGSETKTQHLLPPTTSSNIKSQQLRPSISSSSSSSTNLKPALKRSHPAQPTSLLKLLQKASLATHTPPSTLILRLSSNSSASSISSRRSRDDLDLLQIRRRSIQHSATSSTTMDDAFVEGGVVACAAANAIADENDAAREREWVRRVMSVLDEDEELSSGSGGSDPSSPRAKCIRFTVSDDEDDDEHEGGYDEEEEGINMPPLIFNHITCMDHSSSSSTSESVQDINDPAETSGGLVSWMWNLLVSS